MLVVAQIAIGAHGVSAGLTPLVRGLHLAGAAAVWAAVIVLLGLVARARLAARSAPSSPSAEGARERRAPYAPLRGY